MFNRISVKLNNLLETGAHGLYVIERLDKKPTQAGFRAEADQLAARYGQLQR
jgi:hypothetical protein